MFIFFPNVLPSGYSTFYYFYFYFWQNFPFAIELPLHLCWKLIENIWVGLFLHSIPLIYMSILSPIPYCVNDWIYITPWNWVVPSDNYICLFQNLFGSSGSFVCPYNFRIILISPKISVVILIIIVLTP